MRPTQTMLLFLFFYCGINLSFKLISLNDTYLLIPSYLFYIYSCFLSTYIYLHLSYLSLSLSTDRRLFGQLSLYTTDVQSIFNSHKYCINISSPIIIYSYSFNEEKKKNYYIYYRCLYCRLRLVFIINIIIMQLFFLFFLFSLKGGMHLVGYYYHN